MFQTYTTPIWFRLHISYSPDYDTSSQAVVSSGSKIFDGVFLNRHLKTALLDPGDCFLQQTMKIAPIITYRNETDYSCLPLIVIIDFGNSDIKSSGQAGQYWFDDVSLFFQRRYAIQLERNGAVSNVHDQIFPGSLLLANEKLISRNIFFTDHGFIITHRVDASIEGWWFTLCNVPARKCVLNEEGESCLNDSEIINMSEASSPKRGVTTRNIAYIFLIIFLIVAMIAIIGGAYFGLTVVRGAKSVTDPVGELIRQLVVEATPVILPNPVVIIEEINSLARLETSSYAFQDILQIERNKDLLFGVFGESLLFVAYGDVIAGVDLAKMGADDLKVASPTKIIVRIPEAEIFLTDLDNDRSYVADRDIGLLTKGDAELETKIRQEAETRMLEAALANGILDRANEEARNFMATFLGQLGFTEIEFSTTTLPAITPYVQELPKGFVVTPAPLTTPVSP